MKALLNSIKSRWLIATALSVPLFVLGIGNALETSHRESLLQGVKAQLNLHVYALIASADLSGSSIWMPTELTEDRFNHVDSGLFASIYREARSDPEWSSASSSSVLPNRYFPKGSFEAGEITFQEMLFDYGRYFVLDFDVLWENEKLESVPYRFSIYQSSEEFDLQQSAYQETLWAWLTAAVFGMVVIQLVILFWGMRPFSQIASDLDRIRGGKKEHLDGVYPKELDRIVDSINALISHESSLRERYRNTMSNLAHSIKTPLAIIKGETSTKQSSAENQGVIEQVERIDQIISYQLKRSVGTFNPLGLGLEIGPVCEKTVSAVRKAYREKDLQIDAEIEYAEFKGDEGDLYELLGNLIENAAKYCNMRVCVEVKTTNNRAEIVVSDDGPGIPQDMVGELTERGARADTNLPGQGIGLAVVMDIISSYEGEIQFGSSDEGGAKISLLF